MTRPWVCEPAKLQHLASYKYVVAWIETKVNNSSFRLPIHVLQNHYRLNPCPADAPPKLLPCGRDLRRTTFEHCRCVARGSEKRVRYFL